MLEEVLQNGKSAIRDFLSQVPDSTGQGMADAFGGYFGHVGSFAEMSDDSVRRSKRIYESALASLHDTDLSRLDLSPDSAKEDVRTEVRSRKLSENDLRPEFDKASNQQFWRNQNRQSQGTEFSSMDEKKNSTRHKALCRTLPVVSESELDEATRENLLRLRKANEAADDLVKYIDMIASLLDFSDQVCKIHSRVSSSVHKLEQTAGAVFRIMGNEITNPEKLARAASEFNAHMSDVSMVLGNFAKILEKTKELQSLASNATSGISDFYSQNGDPQARKLVAKSAVAKEYKNHTEVIVSKVNKYHQKTQGKLTRISEAFGAWRSVQDAMRERNQEIQSAISVFQTAPCKMPSVVYEAIAGNDYSFKTRDIGELQNVIDDSVRSILGWLTQRIELMQDVQPKLDRFEERHVNKTSAFPSYILLNETRYASREGSWIKVEATVPHVHLFPFVSPMSIPDKGIAQILLLRLATALPLGCCDITILDHEAQGGSVLGIATMKNVPGLVNLVVRRDQIADAIRSLYEYSGMLVEDGYFTTEEPDWKSYNAKHLDSPLPYKVLVVFSLAGIERVTDGMSMLQSLMKNGCKRGIHVVFAGDAHDQVCGDDPRFASDRKNKFSDVAIDVIQS